MEEVMVIKLTKSEIIDILNNFFNYSNFEVFKFKDEKDFFDINIKDIARRFNIRMITKNITSCGWRDKPQIKRIQTVNLSDRIIYTNKVSSFLLSGLIKCKDKYILVVWNAYRYIHHTTNRSCYINDKDILECYNKGYCFVHDFDQEIWLCDCNNFNLLIRDYIMFNYVESM